MRQAKYVLLISITNFFLFIGIVFVGPYIFPKIVKYENLEILVTATPQELIVSDSPTQTPTLTPIPQVSDCIVTINGTKYNVTNLRKTHSGGDIFKCGSDMTSIFFNQHDQSLLEKQMVKYKI